MVSKVNDSFNSFLKPWRSDLIILISDIAGIDSNSYLNCIRNATEERIDQAISEAEEEVASGAEPISLEEAKEQLDKK